jgi:hypothetical protein
MYKIKQQLLIRRTMNPNNANTDFSGLTAKQIARIERIRAQKANAKKSNLVEVSSLSVLKIWATLKD